MEADPGRAPARMPRVARAYAAARPWVNRLPATANALLTGMFLGLMDDDALAALDEDFYTTHREALAEGDLLYTDAAHITRGLVAWEVEALTRHVLPGARLVITGAGAGREVLGALELGLYPLAFEPNAELCAAGNRVLAREDVAPRLTVSARDAFPPTGPADAVLVGWTSYSHIAGRARRIAFLRAARAVLPVGGPLILSCVALRGRPRYFAHVERAARSARRVTSRPAPELGDVLSPGFLHCFTQAEVEAELADGGFRCIEFAFAPYPHAVATAV